jgi:hypothetical protein
MLGQSTINIWTMAMFHVQQEYIAQNLCVNRFDAIPVCNGQCYLDKQLQENNEENKESSLDTRQSEISLFFQPIQLSYLKFFGSNGRSTSAGNSMCQTALAFKWSIDHPPEKG